ncbi:MAG TPA: MarC family protein [Beijerinckiaceae bacterium]|nr:MarC family protein [Beijerinckiaceae bacterium]
MTVNAWLSAFVTLLVTVDPLGLAPLFLTVTRQEPSRRWGIACRAGVIAFVVLGFFALFGQALLAALGIGLPALRIAGGLLLFWIAFEMVFETRPDRKQDSTAAATQEQQGHDLAVFPLAIPLVAGPGAITAVILIAGQTDASVVSKLTLIALVGLVIGACVAAFFAASAIGRILGDTGTVVFSRVLGLVLAALAVQFVIDGIKSVFRL